VSEEWWKQSLTGTLGAGRMSGRSVTPASCAAWQAREARMSWTGIAAALGSDGELSWERWHELEDVRGGAHLFTVRRHRHSLSRTPMTCWVTRKPVPRTRRQRAEPGVGVVGRDVQGRPAGSGGHPQRYRIKCEWSDGVAGRKPDPTATT
jgi:hypothetical protein